MQFNLPPKSIKMPLTPISLGWEYGRSEGVPERDIESLGVMVWGWKRPGNYSAAVVTVAIIIFGLVAFFLQSSYWRLLVQKILIVIPTLSHEYKVWLVSATESRFEQNQSVLVKKTGVRGPLSRTKCFVVAIRTLVTVLFHER